PHPVLNEPGRWPTASGLLPHYLTTAAGETVGLYVRHLGPEPGPILCLDACIDTAPFGDETRWSKPPVSGHVEGGRLWGRGSADSKIGAAILAHVVRELERGGAGR